MVERKKMSYMKLGCGQIKVRDLPGVQCGIRAPHVFTVANVVTLIHLRKERKHNGFLMSPS